MNLELLGYKLSFGKSVNDRLPSLANHPIVPGQNCQPTYHMGNFDHDNRTSPPTPQSCKPKKNYELEI